MKPYTTFELDQFRQLARRYQNTSCKVHGCCVSVCPSVTRWYCAKTTGYKRRI